ncbi:gas vesicle protein GvpO [Methanosarcina sp. Mfa9]|uniref:gas vesicle protein GvpO n=1 Tax=Methanosarcina sp. Mfa9 TaxID=3439063 RepID=UPI003F861573
MATRRNIKKICGTAVEFLESMLNRKAEGIINMSMEDESWKIQVEVLERKAVPDTQDQLGIYEVRLDDGLNIMQYRKVGIRKRTEMFVEEEE